MADREDGIPPVMIASGALGRDGYGGGLDPNLPLGELHAVVLKTVTMEPRAGNPEPRVIRIPYGTINSVGLENPGLEALIGEVLPRWRNGPARVVVSIAAGTPEELGRMAKRVGENIRRFPELLAIELNLSCPNQGEPPMGTDSVETKEAVRAARRSTDLPVWAKLAPNLPDIQEIARSAERAGADALTVANTMPVMMLGQEKGNPRMGGLSGEALFRINLRLAHLASQAVRIPVWGCGGIGSSRDARIYLMAGARGVQVGTAARENPWRAITTAREIREGGE